MFEFGILASCLLAGICVATGGAIGWFLRGYAQEGGLELRAQAADIDWLRAALSDSEKRCAQQAEWLTQLEEELSGSRPKDDPKAAFAVR